MLANFSQEDPVVSFSVVHGVNVPSPARLIAEDEDTEPESDSEDPNAMLTRPVAEEYVVKRGYNQDPGACLCVIINQEQMQICRRQMLRKMIK